MYICIGICLIKLNVHDKHKSLSPLESAQRRPLITGLTVSSLEQFGIYKSLPFLRYNVSNNIPFNATLKCQYYKNSIANYFYFFSSYPRYFIIL